MDNSLANAVSANRVSVIQDACQGLAVRHMYQENKVLIPHCNAVKTEGLNLQIGRARQQPQFSLGMNGKCTTAARGSLPKKAVQTAGSWHAAAGLLFSNQAKRSSDNIWDTAEWGLARVAG